ncbi:MAG: hypothetical protein Q9226_004517 [Calogaya cf. arnoldii]
MAKPRTPDRDRPEDRTAYIQPPIPPGIFPFEKLPVELQLMVIQFAMPQKGLRFQRQDRRYYNATRGTQRWWYSWTRLEDHVPTGLFLTNHYLSAIALDSLHREVYMHVGVSFAAVNIFDQEMPLSGLSEIGPGLPSRVPADKMLYFTSMRRYRLNIRFGDYWDNGDPADFSAHRDLLSLLQENLRLTSDMLAENPDIQRLTVTFPCQCARPRGTPPKIPKPEQYLTIIKRIKVRQPAVFIPAHGPDAAEADLCTKPECLHLAQSMQSALEHLNGEALSHREETWKRVKAIKRPRGWEYHAIMELWYFWRCFKTADDETFERETKVIDSKLKECYYAWETETETETE